MGMPRVRPPRGRRSPIAVLPPYGPTGLRLPSTTQAQCRRRQLTLPDTRARYARTSHGQRPQATMIVGRSVHSVRNAVRSSQAVRAPPAHAGVRAGGLTAFLATSLAGCTALARYLDAGCSRFSMNRLRREPPAPGRARYAATRAKPAPPSGPVAASDRSLRTPPRPSVGVCRIRSPG